MAPFLHVRFPGLDQSLPHLALGRPTPVRAVPALGEGVWLKDDGAFGSGGWGGNKVRKLEWILPAARRKGARTILTAGGLGTNWGLATALYAREQGLDVALALVDQPIDDHVQAQLRRLENSGATLHFTHTKARTIAALPWLLLRHRRPYLLPPGGSTPTGALGYVEAALELADQVERGELPEPSHVVVPVGTGGTVAGLLAGLRLAGLGTRVVGVVVNDALKLDEKRLTRLARRTQELVVQEAELADLIVRRDWLGPGYGHATPEAEDARRLAESDGLELENVYTAKALAGLLALRERGELAPGPILFLQTHGPRPTRARPHGAPQTGRSTE